jgi:hypothetical protein
MIQLHLENWSLDFKNRFNVIDEFGRAALRDLSDDFRQLPTAEPSP